LREGLMIVDQYNIGMGLVWVSFVISSVVPLLFTLSNVVNWISMLHTMFSGSSRHDSG